MSRVHFLLFGYQQPVGTGKVVSGNDVYRNIDSLGATVAEGGSKMVERPKLNLKPRSQPLDQSHGRFERDRLVNLVIRCSGILFNSFDFGNNQWHFKKTARFR